MAPTTIKTKHGRERKKKDKIHKFQRYKPRVKREFLGHTVLCEN